MLKRYILKRSYIFIISIICCFSNPVSAGERVRVVVLPFEINAEEAFSALRTEIPETIAAELMTYGIFVIDPGLDAASLIKETGKQPEKIRELGLQFEADFIIQGSLTLIAEKFSLDISLIKSKGTDRPETYFVQGEGIKNLPVFVKELTGKFRPTLLKQEVIIELVVEGNNRIEDDAILRVITTKPGDVFFEKTLSKDLKAVYSMGYFDDIRIESEKGPKGIKIIFKVKEKPTIRKVLVSGNHVYDDEEIMENLDIRRGSILNIYKIGKNIKRLEELYKEKNFHNTRITHTIKDMDNNQADLEFVIQEGEKVWIKEIVLDGNSEYSDKQLKKIMKTSERGFFSWLTSSGDFKQEMLSQDVARLSLFYQNNGFAQARIGEPQIEYEENKIKLTIKINEGVRFKVGKVFVDGDLIKPSEELLKDLKTPKEKYFNLEVIRNDTILLTDIYSDEGYFYADISPRMDKDPVKQTVDIVFVIDKGKLVYFDKILIGGNTKTRDKVIRRELNVYEQGLYSGKRLKRGVRNLYRLDFFEDVKVDTIKGDSDEKMILKVDVTEKPTGAFSFGAGYSSAENLFGMLSISQNNLFGRGQVLQLKGELGGKTNRYTISFTEPWLFDIPLSAGFDLYDTSREYDTYDRDSMGGGFRFGYPVYDYTRAYFSYAYEVSKIMNINEVYASKTVKELEGTNTTSSISLTLRYDSRDRAINATEGSEHRISVEYAGSILGGNIGFTKYTAETGTYIPLYKNLVGFLHGKTGYVQKNPDGDLPDYERFYLGGMNSIRGFDWRDIHVTDEDGAEIGGDKFVQFNVEILIPILKGSGIVGVVFYDTGNVYDNNETIDLGNMRQSAGYGFRWYSPMGPIRLEYGYILDAKEGERTGGWEFTMGTAF